MFGQKIQSQELKRTEYPFRCTHHNITFHLKSRKPEKQMDQTARSFSIQNKNKFVLRGSQSQKIYNKYQSFYPKALNASLQNIKRQKKKEDLDYGKWADVYTRNEKKEKTKNGFPIRNKKSGQQFLINMLFKYEKQQRNNKKEDEEDEKCQEKKKYYLQPKRQKKFKVFKKQIEIDDKNELLKTSQQFKFTSSFY